MIEDDFELAKIFTTFLKNRGLNVIVFTNAEEALQHFLFNINLYSIVITDFRMKGMNGIDLAKKIRQVSGTNIVIIMITGYSVYQNISKEEFFSVIDRVIIKPFSLKSLDSILSHYLKRFSKY